MGLAAEASRGGTEGTERGGALMKNRRTTLLWMKDLIDHMTQCHDQLQWAADGPTESFLMESMLVDLVECQRLCVELRDLPSGQSRPLMASA
jgi:hypothetical protein